MKNEHESMNDRTIEELFEKLKEINKRLERLAAGQRETIESLKGAAEKVGSTSSSHVDTTKGYPLDWKEQKDQSRRQEEMRDFDRRRYSGQLSPDERDYSRREYVPGQGYVRTWRRPDEWTIERVPVAGYRKVFRRG